MRSDKQDFCNIEQNLANMKKPVFIALGFMAMVLLSFAFTRDEPRYKNLKVLPKNINKQQMDSVMKHFAAALGVKCNHCHVFNQEQKAMDFASDANEHKAVARSMVKMTNKLNKKYFDVNAGKDLNVKLEVTCYTCHNGKAEPTRMAPAMAQGPQSGPRPDTARRQQ